MYQSKTTRDPNNYNDLNFYLQNDKRGKRKSIDDRPIDNNTRVIRRSHNSIAIKLWDTDIITFYDNGSIQLDTGGWKTVLTKERMNQYLPSTIRVYSEQYIWYIRFNKKQYLFENGMYLTYDRIITDSDGNPIAEHSKDVEKKKRSQLKKINEYIQLFLKALQNGEVPAPSQGDCFICQAFNGQPIADKMSEGKLVNGKLELTPFKDNPHCDCIQSHIDEPYFVPTLLWNAIKSECYDAEGIFGNPKMTYGLSRWDKHNISCWFNHDSNLEHKPFASDMTIKRLQKVMKQFILKQLNF